MRAWLALGLALGSYGCGSIPEGRFRCDTAADCPSGWFCVAAYCSSTPGSGLDGATLDARPPDGGPDLCAGASCDAIRIRARATAASPRPASVATTG